MRQIISSGSVKAFFLDRKAILKRLKDASKEALRIFPQIQEVRLFGSIARGEDTGLSDVDIFILADDAEDNPIERIKPYFRFFSDKIDIAIDIVVARKDEIGRFRHLLQDSLLLYRRECNSCGEPSSKGMLKGKSGDIMQRKRRPSTEEKGVLIEKISNILKTKEYVLFAYIFGSFASGERFNDIDVGIFISAERTRSPLRLELEIENELQDAIRIPVDVRIINNAPLSFIYNILKK